MTDQESDDLKGSSPERENGLDYQVMENLSKYDALPPNKMNNKLAMFKNKMKDGKRAIVRLKRQQEDTQLNGIISDLMLLESHLRTEQTQILSQLATRDATIVSQRQEIDRLRRDNRRLISRLKKITENRECREEKCNGEEIGERDDKVQGKKNTKGNSKRSADNRQILMTRPFGNQSVMTTLASQFYEKSALQFTDGNGRIIDRVMHKPPIAEKPKIAIARATHRPVTAVVRALNGQCNIVSTISRLLDEESDQGINGSSGSSEPSSPESTLKPTTPRVIRLARQYEKGLTISHGSSSSDSGRSGDDQSVKAMMMDEYEVTSGYNSDAVSDLDHDYENILLYKENPQNESERGNSNSTRETDDDDNYVVLRAVRDGTNDIILVEDDDQHIYSNIEYGTKDKRKIDSEEGTRNLILVTDFNEQNTVEDSNNNNDNRDVAKNVPRSRHNIDLVINSSEDSHLMDNFEEFTFDSLDLEDLNGDIAKGKENLPLIYLRHSGDGAESKTPTTTNERRELKCIPGGQGGYEKFLEITGLSQKSILTPSRMFSNHRSVLKPRDIKHRDKLRAVFTSLSTLEEVPATSGTSSATTSQQAQSQRYWREPYL